MYLGLLWHEYPEYIRQVLSGSPVTAQCISIKEKRKKKKIKSDPRELAFPRDLSRVNIRRD